MVKVIDVVIFIPLLRLKPRKHRQVPMQ